MSTIKHSMNIVVIFQYPSVRVHGLTSKVYVFEFMLKIYQLAITGVRLGTSVKEKEGTWLSLILKGKETLLPLIFIM